MISRPPRNRMMQPTMIECKCGRVHRAGAVCECQYTQADRRMIALVEKQKEESKKAK